jgi:hypothetical protein
MGCIFGAVQKTFYISMIFSEIRTWHDPWLVSKCNNQTWRITMAALREEIERSFAAVAFAERGRVEEARWLLRGEDKRTAQREQKQSATQRPRPTMRAE